MKSFIFNQKKILFLLVETTIREFDFKLILAVMSSQTGWQIFVGNHVDLIRLAKCTANALFLIKDTGKKIMEFYNHKNHRIIHLDEETGILHGHKITWPLFLSLRLDVNKLRKKDYICAWGSFQEQHYKSYIPKCIDNIHVTGHPKFDLCRRKYSPIYQKEVADLKAKHGKIILINTNFCSNDCRGRYTALKSDAEADVNTSDKNLNIELFTHYYKIEASFFELFALLSKEFIEHTIVIRPHPSENMIAYDEFCKYLPRLVVTRDGSLNAWLHASEVLIHNGCTTAVEGYQSGIPIINYVPVSDERFDIVIPNLLGTTCRTAGEVLKNLKGIFDKSYNHKTNEQYKADVEEMIANINPEIDAFENIKNIISQCQDEAINTDINSIIDLIIIRKMLEYRLISSFFRDAIKAIKNILKPKTYKGSDKFPDFNETEILAKIKIIEEITGKKVKVHFHTHRILSITQ
jgi:surface carbohydrate biosynthesis protein